MRHSVLDILSSFQAITLECMDPVKLMTRSDEKYVCRIDQLPGILEAARPEFQVLEHLNNRLMAYESLYLDTPDHEMYLMHHNGKLNRYKIRIREYRDSQEFFLEIKFKDNRGITKKKRIRIGADGNYLGDEIRNFMLKNSTYTPEMLKPMLSSSFERITLANTNIQQRVTIDLHPGWHFCDRRINLSHLVILEVKSAKTSNSGGFGFLLREARIQPFRLSKYCTGTVLLYPEIKNNRFKAKLFHLQKLDKNLNYYESFHAIS